MRYSKTSYVQLKSYFIIVLSVVLLFSFSQEIMAQEPPPRPVDITVVQQLGFGAFAHGAVGGIVTVSSTGSRSASGDIILLNMGYFFSAAVFKLSANQGTVISLLTGPDVVLPGSNGGSVKLHIENSNPVSPFIITADPPASTQLSIGGKLIVGNSSSNPPGNYSGTFNITLIQE